MKHHLATAALLIAALVCYGLGLESGGHALIWLGAGMELWFWARVAPGFGILSSKRPRRDSR